MDRRLDLDVAVLTARGGSGGGSLCESDQPQPREQLTTAKWKIRGLSSLTPKRRRRT